MVNKKIEVVISSKNISLKPFDSFSPSKRYIKWMNDPEITKYIVKSSNTSEASIKNFLIEMNTFNNFFFKIIYNKNSFHIGNLRIGPLDFKKQISKFGIMIGEKYYHGRGLGKESTLLAENFVFDFLNFKMIQFECIEENIAAMRIYRNLGYFEKKINKKLKIKNNYFNQVIFYKHKS